MRKFAVLAATFGLALSISASALAQEAAKENWNLTLGLGIKATPKFLGSKDYSALPYPVFGLGRGLGSRWWSAQDDAMGPGLIDGQRWRVGISGALLWPRLQRSDAALRGLGDVRFGFEAGVFGEYYVMPWLRARADIRHGFLAHNAIVADLKVDAFHTINQFTFGFGPRLSLAGSDFNRSYFGVNAAQSAASGLPVFRPGGGLQSAGALAQVTYAWTPRFRTTGYAEYKRLLGDAGASPLIKQRGSADQFTFGLSSSYTFDLGF